MSVYSKCQGIGCTKRDSCLRYTVEALPKYQPWMVMQVSIPQPDKCKFFIDNSENILTTHPTPFSIKP